MDFMELARARYSCRSLSDRPVAGELVDRIIEAARLAPTATNAQAWRIWVADTPQAVEKVNRATPCHFGAGTILVLGAKPDAAWTRDTDGHSFADVDAGIVGAHILLEVQQLGLGTTWVGRIDPEALVGLFPEMEGYTIVGLFPIGYPSQTEAGQPGRKHDIRRPASETIVRL